MITTYIIFILIYILQFILTPLTFLPEATADSTFLANLVTFSGYYNSIKSILPADGLAAFLSTAMIVEMAIFTYYLIMWVVKKIPGMK